VGLTELLAKPDVEHSRQRAALALGALLAGEPLAMKTGVSPRSPVSGAGCT
jgi:hypothetical protein